MSRGTAAIIDLAALRHNFARARSAAPRSTVVAVIKANAYGHGAVPVARALDTAPALAVSVMEEAQALREAGEMRPVTVLQGPVGREDLQRAAEQNLTLVVHAPWQVELLGAWRGGPLEAWIKLDTGMHRLGLPAERAAWAWQRLQALPRVRVAGWMTHLACADELDPKPTRAQLHRFAAIADVYPAPRSIANSAGILAWPQTRTEQVREGIMLYGASPFVHRSAHALGLKPVMTLASRIIDVHQFAAGEPVGYGATFRCPEDMPVGVVAIGYGDGYPRHAPSGTPVLVNGRRARLAGRVSMDMLSVDLRGVGPVRPGDPVVLWGDGLPCDEVARAAGTIAYELFCGVAARVPRRYREER